MHAQVKPRDIDAASMKGGSRKSRNHGVDGRQLALDTRLNEGRLPKEPRFWHA
jgi:hypothetical protein